MFFGGNEKKKICFWNLLTFNRTSCSDRFSRLWDLKGERFINLVFRQEYISSVDLIWLISNDIYLSDLKVEFFLKRNHSVTLHVTLHESLYWDVRCNFCKLFVNFLNTAFPHIVSSLELFPPLDSVRGQNLLIIYIQLEIKPFGIEF